MITMIKPRSRSTESTRVRRSGLYSAVGVTGAEYTAAVEVTRFSIGCDVPFLLPANMSNSFAAIVLPQPLPRYTGFRDHSIMTKLLPRIALAALVVSAVPLHAQTRPVNWDSLSREATTVLADYLRINTTNPPGNEILTARFLKAILEKEGIEAQILDTTK